MFSAAAQVCRSVFIAAMLFVLIAAMLFALSNQLYADDEKPNFETERRARVQRQLKEINTKIGKERTRITSLKQKQRNLERSVEAIKKETRSLEEKRKAGLAAIAKLEEESVSLERAVQKVEKEIDQRREMLKSRLVSVYKMRRRVSVVDFLVSATNSTDMLKRLRFMRIIAEHDQENLSGLADLVLRLGKKKSELETVLEKKGDQLKSLERLREELERKRLNQASLIKDVENQRNAREKSVTRLKSAASNLDRVLSSLMGGEEEPIQVVRKTPDPKKTAVPVVKPRPATKTYSGAGLAKVRGSLPLPAKARLVQGYGKRRHDEFSDMVFSKGVEFEASVGAKVKAIAPGKVIFNQVLSGFGNVVILDHGKRYYTLYGRLATSLCRVGDVLKRGDVIAVIGEADARGRNLYFELRLKGKAIDPTKFFASLPSEAKSG